MSTTSERQHLPEHAPPARPIRFPCVRAACSRFARWFGIPAFLVGQTLIVVAWITANAVLTRIWDPYPFILLYLSISLPAATPHP